MTTVTNVLLTTLEIVLKSSINKLMRVFLTSPKLLPQKLPEVYKDVDLIISKDFTQIDIKIQYAKGNPIKSEIDRVVGIFPPEVKASYAVIGGDYITKFYKSYESTVQLVEDERGLTKAIRTYKVELKPDSPDFSKFVAFDIENLKKIDNIAFAIDD